MKSTDETTLSLADFPPADKQTWKAQILQDIRKATAEEKQAVYEDKMRWKTFEGITIEPFYTQEDIQDLPPINVGIPQQSWHNRQYIRVKDARTANTMATAAIHGGADALLLDLQRKYAYGVKSFPALAAYQTLAYTSQFPGTAFSC
jgi:methylmalonyl-CoA mutase